MDKALQHIDFQILDGIAYLGFDMKDKAVNIFTQDTIDELSLCLRKVFSNSELHGVIIYSKKKDQFIAGANIGDIASIKDPSVGADKAREGQDLMESIESLKIPVVAAINGSCIGGGLELALACTYRITTDSDKVRLQLPEVQLGILPGFGGTQRLPKWIGLQNALDLILTGRPIMAKKAYRIGLIDDITPEPLLLETAKKWISVGKRKAFPYKQPLLLRFLERIKPVQKIIYHLAKKSIIQKTGGNYPAPLQALDVIQKTFRKTDAFSYDLEAQKLGSLVASPICKSLVQMFQWTEEIKKTSLDLPPQPISKTAILGAGVMGSGIAHLFTKMNKDVRIKDVSLEAIEKGMSFIFDTFNKERVKKKLSRRYVQNKMGHVSFTTNNKGFRKCQFVIEAIVEDMQVKQKVLSDIARFVSPDAIIATNTSALSITEMAGPIPNPERVVGLHFFNPVSRMPLVEIIQGDQTSEQTVSTVYAFALSVGKIPILVADRPGFLVNRILGMYLAEATHLAQDGISIKDIDYTMKKFGMPMGPFELMDEVGIDIASHVGKFLGESFGYFPTPSNILSPLLEAGRLGRKNNLGFYQHKGNHKKLDQSFIKKMGLSTSSQTPDDKIERVIVDRLVLLMGNEAYRCLGENVVRSERDIDVGMVLGTGFAPFRGGLAHYMKSRNLENVKTTLTAYSAKYGKHFEPCQKLIELSYR
ncbi:MAG: enoyl-CoA hydratase/isomerase family protein [Bdellovibrionales bacterium]|nr:enoyl-CoA hydratase/isomerase family protein [Bdellovibrionales bacterium]